MNIIYPYTIYVDKGRLSKRGKYGTLTDSKGFCENPSLGKGKLQA
jgi:hypothetical protein